MMLNAQLDGIVALGIGGAIALWSRPYLAGLALGLTLMKPQLVLPLGLGLILARRWMVLAGWATAGVALLASTLLLDPHWVFDWLGQIRSTVQTGAREVNLAHFAIYLPPALQTLGLVGLTLLALSGGLVLAARRHRDFNAAAAILVIGGVVASPHALPSDLVLVAVVFALSDVGPGRWSLDEALGTRRAGPGWALAQLAAGAIGSSAVVAMGERGQERAAAGETDAVANGGPPQPAQDPKGQAART